MRPVLKWAGGKRQLLPELRRFVPPRFRSYHEPFFGSGALFFDLCERGELRARSARLVDTNADLIGCYTAIARDVEAVIRSLRSLAGARHNAREHYYRVRDTLFNPARSRFFAEGRTAADYPADLAAMFIYLNRTGFNGLFRLNARGGFNVPAGRYTNPRICDDFNLRAAAAALWSPGVRLLHAEFESVLASARPGDFVYFDPPYAPLSTTARFTSYTAAGFSEDDQRRLQQVVLRLVKRKCFVVLSNSTAPIVSQLYGQNAEARGVGLQSYEVPARRAINSDPGGRGKVIEYIVSNVSPQN